MINFSKNGVGKWPEPPFSEAPFQKFHLLGKIYTTPSLPLEKNRGELCFRLPCVRYFRLFSYFDRFNMITEKSEFNGIEWLDS